MLCTQTHTHRSYCVDYYLDVAFLLTVYVTLRHTAGTVVMVMVTGSLECAGCHHQHSVCGRSCAFMLLSSMVPSGERLQRQTCTFRRLGSSVMELPVDYVSVISVEHQSQRCFANFSSSLPPVRSSQGRLVAGSETYNVCDVFHRQQGFSDGLGLWEWMVGVVGDWVLWVTSYECLPGVLSGLAGGRTRRVVSLGMTCLESGRAKRECWIE